MFAVYDMDDNLMYVSDTYKELAKYFNTSVIVMHTTMSRIKSGIRKKREQLMVNGVELLEWRKNNGIRSRNVHYNKKRNYKKMG